MTTPRVHWAHLGLLAALAPLLWLAGARDWSPAATLFAWLLANVVVLAIAERLAPFRAGWHPTARHLRRDGGVAAANVLVDAAVSAALTALAIALLPGDNRWPLVAQVALGLLAGELAGYWLHRLSHRDGWLWRVHLLHHVPDRLNLANAATAHPLNAALDKAARLLPPLGLGLQPDAMLAIALFGATQSLVAHANVAGGIGVLDRVLGSAQLHRMHHSAAPAEAGNFGTAISLWDLVFGTYRRGTPAAVGVFSPSAYPGELDLARLLVWPLRLPAWLRRRWRCCGGPALGA